MHATGHAKLTITILDVMQPLNFPVFYRVGCLLEDKLGSKATKQSKIDTFKVKASSIASDPIKEI